MKVRSEEHGTSSLLIFNLFVIPRPPTGGRGIPSSRHIFL